MKFKLLRLYDIQSSDRLFPKSTNDRPSSPKNRSPIPKIKQRSLLTTHKPDRLFPQTKQRSPLITHKPDRLNLNIKQRSPLNTHKPDRIFPHTKQRSLLTTHKTRSPISKLIAMDKVLLSIEDAL